MTTAQLILELDHIDHSKTTRNFYSNYFIDHPEFIPVLLDVVFDNQLKFSYKAAWILEFTCSKNINILEPYLDIFCSKIKDVTHDSAKRPMAKICELLTLNHYKPKNDTIRLVLTANHKTQLTECCFDWMIQVEKVAVKAYAMHTLFLLGTEIDWIHPELKTILEKDFVSQSAAFKARSRHILKGLKE